MNNSFDKRFTENFKRHYRVPEDYMDRLEQQMLQRIQTEAPARQPKRWRKFITVAAASIILFMMIKPFFKTGHQWPDKSQDSLQVYMQTEATNDEGWDEIPDDVIMDYLLMEEDDFEI